MVPSVTSKVTLGDSTSSFGVDNCVLLRGEVLVSAFATSGCSTVACLGDVIFFSSTATTKCFSSALLVSLKNRI